MRGNPKHRSDYDSTSEEEDPHYISKKGSHHHKRKHKKHKHKTGEIDEGNDKNGNDDSSLRNEIIEIHGSSSEDDCKNGVKYGYNDKKNDSHKSRHHSREDRRHRKRRKLSETDFDTQSRDKEVENRQRKHRGYRERVGNRESESESEHERRNDHRKRRSRELSGIRNRDGSQRDEHDMKNRGEAKGREKTRFEVNVDNVKKEPDEREMSKRNCSDSEARRNNNRGGPSGRSNDRSRGSRDRNVHEWGNSSGNKNNGNKTTQKIQKPNFGLSGKLTEDTNTYNGVVIKYSEPPEARMPKKRWRLYPFKGEEALPPLYIHRQSAYLLGRDRKVVDMPIDHPSCSKQHAALQYRLITYERPNGSVGKQIRLYIIDLESANGTFINNKKIEPKKYVELFEKDVIKFGFSSREYVLLHEHSKDDDPIQDDT